MIGYWHHHVICLSIRLSVMLCIVLLGVSVQAQMLYQHVPNRQIPICPFRHFCCRMYRLAAKHTEKRVEENANVSFLRQTIMRALVVLHSVIH